LYLGIRNSDTAPLWPSGRRPLTICGNPITHRVARVTVARTQSSLALIFKVCFTDRKTSANFEKRFCLLGSRCLCQQHRNRQFGPGSFREVKFDPSVGSMSAEVDLSKEPEGVPIQTRDSRFFFIHNADVERLAASKEHSAVLEKLASGMHRQVLSPTPTLLANSSGNT
jgi:hypothetical protein